MMRSIGIAGLVLALLAGCGDLTSGGAGEVDVAITSGEVDPGTGERLLGDAALEGTLSVQLRVFVQREGGSWVELTDGVQEVELSLASAEPIEVARRSIREGRHDRVRMVFGRVEALVVRGLSVEGDTITGRVPVDLGVEGRLELERELQFDVRGGEPVEILLELKAADWLRRLDIQACRASSCRVDEADFEDELRVRSGTVRR